MSKIENGGPAFPEAVAVGPSGDVFPGMGGMSLRDWFAGQIAGGMAAFSGTAGLSYGPGEIAGRAYQIADAMVSARSRVEP